MDREFFKKLHHLDWNGLRSDLIITPTHAMEGKPTWIIEDPDSGSHFAIGVSEMELIKELKKHPSLVTAVKQYQQNTKTPILPQDLFAFINSLLQEGLAINTQSFPPKETRTSLTKVLKSLIYFRIPLLKPDQFLHSTLGFVKFLGSWWFTAICVIIGIIACTLTFPKFELYLSTIDHFNTPKGIISFLCTITVIKIGHELAHAYVAKSYHCFIRSIGVAFILGWPVLFTDTTDAWKLKDNSHRFRIDSAGIRFELSIAAFALLFWNVLPEGLLKSICFYLSFVSLALTLLVNLNPLMKFDGYFMLSDWLNIPNLQQRSSELLKFYFRRFFLDWKSQNPEVRTKKILLSYGIASATYRIFLWLSIAFIAYNYFFKALGAIVFISLIIFFFVNPWYVEIKFIFKHRTLIGSKLVLLRSFVIATLFAFLLSTPYHSSQIYPAVFKSKEHLPIYNNHQGTVKKIYIQHGDEIKKGDVLFELENNDLNHEASQLQIEQKMVNEKLKYLTGGGSEGPLRDLLLVERKRLNSRIAELQYLKSQLTLKASQDGVVVDLPQEVREGATIGTRTYLLSISNNDEFEIEAYFLASEIEHIKNKSHAYGIFEAYGQEQRLIKKNELSYPSFNLGHNMLYTSADGPILESNSLMNQQPLARDAYVKWNFIVEQPPHFAKHNLPCSIYLINDKNSLIFRALLWVKKELAKEGWIFQKA